MSRKYTSAHFGTFYGNVQSALNRKDSKLKRGHDESSHVDKYLKTVIPHLHDIVDSNHDLTVDEINTILFKEIDDYAKTVYENSYAFEEYFDYICAQYLSQNPNKYEEISAKLIESDLNFDKLSYGVCHTFDEYLLLYTYRKKRDLFEQFFEGLESTFPPTSDNFKRFDELLQKNISLISKSYFSEWFTLPEVSKVFSSSDTLQKKYAKLKEYSTWYKNPKDKKDFLLYSNIFLHGSYAYVLSDTPYLEQEIRKDLARATSRIVKQLDNLGHLDAYMVDFVFEMSRMRYPEFANVICNNGFPTKDFVDSVTTLSDEIARLSKYSDSLPDGDEKNNVQSKIDYLTRNLYRKKSLIYPNLNKDKLKSALNENYLSSPKSTSIETLLALNAFWTNRYIKELDLYSEAMFVAHKLDIPKKIINGENIDFDKNDINNILIEMYTLYWPACNFLELEQRKIDNSFKSSKTDDTEYEDGDVEEKIVRFSYEPFINTITKSFGKDYKSYFSKMMPNLSHDIKDDSNWYIRLINPIYSSYLMKDEMINALLVSIDNTSSENFPNAGIILEDFNGNSTISSDGTSATIPYSPVIGIDAGLSFPVRIHVKKDVLVDFLKTINGNAIIPIYEGSEDFHSPYDGRPIASSLILPATDNIKALFKKGIRKKEFESANSPDYHPFPKFVSHLAFSSVKKVPAHLQSPVSGKKKGKSNFVRKFIDLESGTIYQKVNDEYVPVTPNIVKKSGQGDDEHGI